MPWHPPGNRLVLGIGNPLRGDDGVGALLAEQALSSAAAGPGQRVSVRSVQQLTPELAEDLAQLQQVLFIDAWQAPAGASPQLRDLSPGGATGSSGCSIGQSHRLEPAVLLALSQALYGRAPGAQLLLVPAYGFSHGTSLSAGLQAALPQARSLLRQWLNGHA